MKDAPVYLIPGLGADHRNYPSPWTELPGCVCLDWPEYHGRASMPEVARFMAEAWHIPPGAVLVGSSFGGMLACEMAKFIPVRALILVATSTEGRDFTTTVRMKWLTRVLPLRLVQSFLRGTRSAQELLWGRTATPLVRAVLDSIQMFGSCQAGFYRDMFQAMDTWDGFDATDIRMLRIHGRQDKLVRPPECADLYLEGGHMIAMTQAHECADFVRRWLDSHQLPLVSACG